MKNNSLQKVAKARRHRQMRSQTDAQIDKIAKRLDEVIVRIASKPRRKMRSFWDGEESDEHDKKVSSRTKSVSGKVTDMGCYVSLMGGGCYIYVKTAPERTREVNAAEFPGAHPDRRRLDQANGIEGMKVRLTYRLTGWKNIHEHNFWVHEDLIGVEVISSLEEMRGLAVQMLKTAREEFRKRRRHVSLWTCGPLSLLNEDVDEGN